MRPTRLLAPVATLCTAVLGARPAAATVTICATNASNLQAALTAAQDNTEKTIIEVARGFYSAADVGGTFSFSGGPQLDISGGYNSDCSEQIEDPALTVLDGGDGSSDVALLYNTTSGISVRFLTFQNGGGGGLYAFSRTGPVIVSYNIMRLNTGQFCTGAWVGISDGGGTGNVTFWNNLVHANTAVGNVLATATKGGGCIENIGSGSTYVTNNTVADNLLTNPGAGAIGGFEIEAAANVYLSNNIFWANDPGTLDVSIPAGSPVLSHNDIGTLSASPDPASSGNLVVDPQFAGGGSYRLMPTSPLLNAGAVTPAGNLPSIDILGHARTFAGTVDLGAYEQADDIFGDRFGG